MRKTKIVCTIGPASQSEEQIEALVRAGVDVFRLNFSHGDHRAHSRSIARIRRVEERLGRSVAVLQDLQGPKIRLGEIPEERCLLTTGEQIELVPISLSPGEENLGNPLSGEGFLRIPIRYPWLLEDVGPGERILLADGLVELEAEDIRETGLLSRVIVAGEISSRKGVNLPRSELRVPAFTAKDRADLEMGCREGVDMVALSFVRHERDLDPVLEILQAHAVRRPSLLAKIEKPQAVERLDAILHRVDAVMVARGDLGVEMPVEEVPMIQKSIISQARRMVRPVITATQMLRSMVDSPRPTRAEASDVANAVLDGTDAVMLSEESAIGTYPVESVRTLDRIARATEAAAGESPWLDEEIPPGDIQAALARAACMLAHDTGARAIVAATTSGSTARQIARFRPHAPIVGLTTSEIVRRQLGLSRGVIPAQTGCFESTEEIFTLAASYCREKGLALPGETIVVTAGLPIAATGRTNLLHLITV